MQLIAPSILAADFGYLADAVEMINSSNADWLHVDIMDGRFVPNISFGFPVLKAIHKKSKIPLDVHLMIVEPEKYIEQFVEAGAAIITVHYEACDHLHRTIQQIKSLGAKAGVALNPHTPVSLLENVIPELDLVCLMSVNPGFGGQSFIEGTYDKIRRLHQLKQKYQSNLLIEIDGGVSKLNAEKLSKAGANVLVAGSSVFKSENPIESVTTLKNLSVDNLLI